MYRKKTRKPELDDIAPGSPSCSSFVVLSPWRNVKLWRPEPNALQQFPFPSGVSRTHTISVVLVVIPSLPPTLVRLAQENDALEWDSSQPRLMCVCASRPDRMLRIRELSSSDDSLFAPLQTNGDGYPPNAMILQRFPKINHKLESGNDLEYVDLRKFVCLSRLFLSANFFPNSFWISSDQISLSWRSAYSGGPQS